MAHALRPNNILKADPAISASDCSYPDYFIPTHEKSSLLRKFSAPNIPADQTSQLASAAALLPRSPSIDAGLPSLADATSSFVFGQYHHHHHHHHQATALLDDKLKCSLCKNAFNDPRILDCLHTFCFQCLLDMDEAVLLDAVGEDIGRRENSVDLSTSGTTGTTAKSSESMVLPQSYSVASSIDQGREHHQRNGSNGSSRKNSYKRHGRHSVAGGVSFSESTKPIRCAICSTSTAIPIGGIICLPSNFMIARRLKDALAQFGSRLQETSHYWCSLCYNRTAAIACCLICNIHLCGHCKEAHCRQKNTSLHDVRYLSDLKSSLLAKESSGGGGSGGMPSVGANKLLKCVIHPTHLQKMFCGTCNQLVCSNCLIILHRGHKCEPIQKAAKSYIKTLRSSLERTRPLSEYASDSISKLASVRKKFIQSADQIQQEVDSYIAVYIDAIEAHRRTLHKQIARAKETKCLRIGEHEQELIERGAAAKLAIQFADELLQNGTEMESLSLVGLLLRRFEHCQQFSRSFLEARFAEPITFLPELQAPATKDQHGIPMFGIITTQSVVAKLCSVPTVGLQYLRVHRRVELLLTARDCDDRPLCHGGLTTIAVRIRYRDQVTKAVTPNISDNRDGTYLIAFIPDIAGPMIMTITIQEQHIKGSPFQMCARTLRHHSGVFHCCSFCSSRGSKLAECACAGRMPGGYHGCGHGHDGHPGRRHWSCCGNDQETSECSATNSFR